MAKVMLINVTHAEESRVAIVADGILVSFEIESFNREHLKGNIYKGVVQRVHPALEAAFVDIGADRHAFLPLDEICFRHLPNPVRPGGNGERRKPRIQDLLRPGDELLVQIVKEQFGSKPPTLTTFFSLPGRFLVLLPGSDDAGISRRIEGADRIRVREMIEKLQPPEGFGIIVRTVVGFDPGLSDLQRDLTYLLRLWESILAAAQTKRAPALIYREHDLVLRNIRDYFTPDIDEIYVDNEEVFERARHFLRDVLPEKEHALRLYEGDKPIFSHFNIEAQIESVYKRKVPLKSGGYIVIDGTEALTAIDVNSGRAVRGASQEETAFRTNLEAAVEIARQLRLRDVGGLIVIDFIDMRNPQHISEVEKALRTAMFEDKARHEVGRISHFGLLEVSRQRLRPAATATTYVTCRMCDGYGLVRTTESAALVALRKVHNRVAQGDVGSASVSVPTDVAMYLLNQKREDLAQLERRYGVKIVVQPREDLMPHQCEIEVRPRSETAPAETTALRLGGLAGAAGNGAGATQEADSSTEVERPAEPGTAAVPSASASASTSTQEKLEGAARKRRRRGRRRGRGRLAAESLQIMVQTLAGHGVAAVDVEEGQDSAAETGAVARSEVGPTAEVRHLPEEEASGELLAGGDGTPAQESGRAQPAMEDLASSAGLEDDQPKIPEGAAGFTISPEEGPTIAKPLRPQRSGRTDGSPADEQAHILARSTPPPASRDDTAAAALPNPRTEGSSGAEQPGVVQAKKTAPQASEAGQERRLGGRRTRVADTGLTEPERSTLGTESHVFSSDLAARTGPREAAVEFQPGSGTATESEVARIARSTGEDLSFPASEAKAAPGGGGGQPDIALQPEAVPPSVDDGRAALVPPRRRSSRTGATRGRGGQAKSKVTSKVDRKSSGKSSTARAQKKRPSTGRSAKTTAGTRSRSKRVRATHKEPPEKE